MKTHTSKSILLFIALSAMPLSMASGATVFNFESGFTAGQTSFNGGGLAVSLGGPLVVTEFPTFGSSGGDWFVDSGFGTPVSGNAGNISVSTAGIAGFKLLSMDLWTSNNAGSNFAAGNVTLKGMLAGGGSVSAIVSVNPTGNSGEDWDITNDLSVFSGLVLTSVEFSLGAGIDYLAIDNLGMEAVTTVPEPGSLLLTALPLGAWFLRRRVNR